MAAGAGLARAEAPARVVSINLCTDQLAMMLAGDGQLHSVSHIATDRRVSAMADKAAGYVANHGLAEEIYLMRPDLVVAGPYAAQATTAMLQRLGIPVAVIPAATSLDDIPDRIRRMGEVLHREAAAKDMAAAFETRLAAVRAEVAARPSAVLYYANGYTSGATALAGQILLAAGFENAAERAGYGAGTKLPLEMLAMIDPDVVITSQAYPGASRSEEMMDHPAVRAFRESGAGAAMTGPDWVCGTPHVLDAIDRLAGARREITGAAE
uniref:ABC transporter substrate-binding protein n=1 Tax=Roseovarius indicus TaxID=540747 RepID=UPI003B527B43